MGRTLAASFSTEKDRKDARPFRSAVIHAGGTVGDVYIADNSLTIGGNAHQGVVRRWGNLQSLVNVQEGFLGVSSLEIEANNFPNFGSPKKRLSDLLATIGLGMVEVDVYQNFFKVGTSDTVLQELLFSGTIQRKSRTEETCRLTIESLHQKYLNKQVGLVLNQTDWPLIDPDEVGKYANEICGNPKGVVCHAVKAGLQFPLQIAMSAVTSYVAIAQDAYDLIGDNGTVQIGDEKIIWISKTTTPTPRLTGLTRQANATPLQSHAVNDNIVQVLTEYVYMAAGHQCKSLANAKIWRNGLGYPLAGGVTYEPANTTLLPGRTIAVVRISVPPTIKELPVVELSDSQGVSDTIAVNDTIGVSDTIAVVDNIGVSDTIAVNDTIGISQANTEGQWDQGGSDETLSFLAGLPPGATEDILIAFPAQEKTKSSGNFKKQISWLYTDTGVNTEFYIVRGDATALLIFQTGTQKSPSAITIVEAAFWGLKIRRKNVGGVNLGAVSMNVSAKKNSYNIDLQASKTGAASKSGTASKTGAASKSGLASKTGAATKSGTVTLTGSTTLSSTTTAEVVLGKFLTCDVEGYPDDGAGNYTGTPNALITRPVQIMRYFLEQVLGVPAARVDAAAFATANTDMPASYRFDAVLNLDTQQAKGILLKMARQSMLISDWPVDKATVKFRKTSWPAATKTITQDEIMPGTLEVDDDDPANIINVVNLRFDRDWQKGDGLGSYAKVVLAEDATSKAKHGALEKPDRFRFDYIKDSTMALAVASAYLTLNKNPARIVRLAAKLDQFETLIGDLRALKYLTNASINENLDGLDGNNKFIVEDLAQIQEANRVSLKFREVA